MLESAECRVQSDKRGTGFIVEGEDGPGFLLSLICEMEVIWSIVRPLRGRE